MLKKAIFLSLTIFTLALFSSMALAVDLVIWKSEQVPSILQETALIPTEEYPSYFLLRNVPDNQYQALITAGLLPELASDLNIIRLRYAEFDVTRGLPGINPDLQASDSPAAYPYYIVQFHGLVKSSWLDQVEALEVQIFGYIPENAFLMRIDNNSKLQAVKELNTVQWVGLYQPAYKIDETIGTVEFVDPERAADPKLTLTVRLFQDAQAEMTAKKISDLGSEVRKIFKSSEQALLEVYTDPAHLNSIALIPEVLWIEEKPESLALNNTTKWVIQSNVINSTPIWDKGIHGENQIVGILDSGLDYGSCWFRDPQGDPVGANHRKVLAYRPYGGAGSAYYYDACGMGHGTHVSGTVLGNQNPITGSSDYNGIAYMAKATFGDVQGDSWLVCNLGSLQIPSSITSIYNDAYNDGARVHTNSWGSSGGNAYNSYCVDTDQAMWQHKDFLVLYAAGNSGSGSSTVSPPGTAKNIVTVGASEQAPDQNNIADFSSRGPTSDGRYKPTVCAPGVGINSVDNASGTTYQETCNVASGWDGTSMATPAVAGAAALVRQYFVDGFYPTGAKVASNSLNPSAALMKAILIASSDDMPDTTVRPSNDQGWGRVDLDKALFFAGDSLDLVLADETTGISTGQEKSYTFSVAHSGSPVKVVLIWTDYPGTAGTGKTLVNDLDLWGSNGTHSTYGNWFSAAGWSKPGTTADRLNVEECIFVKTAPAGSYTVKVKAFNVPHGPQPFALVVTGDLY